MGGKLFLRDDEAKQEAFRMKEVAGEFHAEDIKEFLPQLNTALNGKATILKNR